MATFAYVAGVKVPDTDRDGQPIIFDSYDMSPVLFGTGLNAGAQHIATAREPLRTLSGGQVTIIRNYLSQTSSVLSHSEMARVGEH
jgi:hypothetical protein